MISTLPRNFFDDEACKQREQECEDLLQQFWTEIFDPHRVKVGFVGQQYISSGRFRSIREQTPALLKALRDEKTQQRARDLWQIGCVSAWLDFYLQGESLRLCPNLTDVGWELIIDVGRDISDAPTVDHCVCCYFTQETIEEYYGKQDERCPVLKQCDQCSAIVCGDGHLAQHCAFTH
jgi:hypothetical protein